MSRIVSAIVAAVALACGACAQESQSTTPVIPAPLQPLAQQAHQIENALAYLGQPLSPEEVSRIDRAIGTPIEAKAVEQLQAVLDPYVLAAVQINAESRVTVEAGPAKPELVEQGTRLFLVKVINDAGVTAQLKVESR